MRRSALLPKRLRETVVCPPPAKGRDRMPGEVAMTTLPRTRFRLAYVAAAVVAPQRSQAENSVQAAPQAADRCSTVLSKRFRRSP